jgi:hypothetical protein
VYGYQILCEVVVDERTGPRVDDAFSSSAMPMPNVIPPINWERAVLAFRMRPGAKTPSMLRSRISAVSASTPTPANCAPYVLIGLGHDDSAGYHLDSCSITA